MICLQGKAGKEIFFVFTGKGVAELEDQVFINNFFQTAKILLMFGFCYYNFKELQPEN